MKLFALIEWLAYEGEELLGVYSTRDLAEAAKDRVNADDPHDEDHRGLRIDEVVLDGAPAPGEG